MAGPLIPLILGAGARILGGQAARAAAAQAARTSASQGARTAVKKTAKSAAKKTTRTRTTKTTTAKKPTTKKTASKKTTATTRKPTQYIDKKSGQPRTPGMRTANKPPKWAQGRWNKGDSVVITRQTAKEKMQHQRLQSMLSQRKTSRSKRMNALRTQAGITGSSAVAYETIRYGINKRNQMRNPTVTPIRPINWDPNRKRKK